MKAFESGANIDVSTHPEVIQDLMNIAELNYDPSVGSIDVSPTDVSPQQQQETDVGQ